MINVWAGKFYSHPVATFTGSFFWHSMVFIVKRNVPSGNNTWKAVRSYEPQESIELQIGNLSIKPSMGTRVPGDTATSAIFISFCLFLQILLCFCQSYFASSGTWLGKKSPASLEFSKKTLKYIVLNMGPKHWPTAIFYQSSSWKKVYRKEGFSDYWQDAS